MKPINRSHTSQELKAVLADKSLFSSLDIHFANFIARLAKTDSPEVPLAAALVSCRTSEGNICLDLAEYAGKVFSINSTEESEQFICPALSDWTDHLMKSGLVGQDEGNTPLVLDQGGRLYLRRYWEYEKSIIHFIQERTNTVLPDINYPGLARDVQKLFQPLSDGKPDWQKIAAILAVTRSFSVISGGPGTGKTSTVAKILVLLLGQYEDKQKLRILLGAPTGKAASRLQEAITSTGLLLEKIELPQATTLHRMLGSMPHSPYFRHNTENPLAADLIIIDEASMVDLPLMAKLMQAVPFSARLILLGDRHQLASVQPGSVLGDICRSEAMNCFSSQFCKQALEISGESLPSAPKCSIKVLSPDLQDSFVELTKNYRFSDESEIARLSKAVKEGDGDAAVDLLLAEGNNQISWSDIPAPAELEKKLRDWPGFSPFVSMQHIQEPAACFAVMDSFRILCGLRRGPYGMQNINTLLTQQFTSGSGLFSQTNFSQQKHASLSLAGQPVMVTQNDYNLQLFNGDVGIILPGPNRKDALRVFFREESGAVRDIALPLLPEHETAFAMTVHKSQGSEFARVLLILPDQDSPLLTRELLYTAITRAREKVEIWGRKNIFASAVKRQIKRTSGLAEALWDGGR
ncbi:exodeoxyribonuclease V subunit alpha [Thermodesulfobacteriota bacterium]